METKVSVIMPSLNVADYIEECMDSIISQTLEEMEIICIDAGSTDGTWEILSKYKNIPKCGKKVRLYHSDVRSYGYQVNLGIRLAQGKYIAIMETDDYADCHMYEYLVGIASFCNLDAVRADCEWFWTGKNGERHYQLQKLWDGSDSRYNRVIDPSMDEYLYEHDYSLWKGIYKREFLISNNIWFNESPGAAYQDIGFMMQFLACAQRVYYSDKSFYRYRSDRETSSISSLHGLQYSKQEFFRLMTDTAVWNKLKCKQGFYRRMTASFMVEYTKVLIAVGYDTDSVYLSGAYEWFSRILKEVIAQALFNLDSIPDNSRTELMLLLDDCRKYAKKIFRRQETYKEKVSFYRSKIGMRDIVIFGAGNWGKCAVRFFLGEKTKPIAIFDNNENLWGENFLDIPIRGPECIAEGQCVVIACKIHEKEMAHQLKDMGLQEEQIVFWKA